MEPRAGGSAVELTPENCNARREGPARVGSDAQHCLVGVFDLLVGPGKTIACVVDLLLGEILDHEEMLSGIARFAQFSMSCDDVRSVDHQTRLPPTRCRGCLRLAVFALG